MSSDINNVEPTNSTNAEEENIYSDSDITPLLDYANSPSEKKFQRIKSVLERFLCAPFKAEGYTLMEGSHRPLGNKLAGMLKHSGNKLTSMLECIKNFSVNLFRVKNEPPINSILISVNQIWALPMDSSGIIQLNNHKPLGNLAGILKHSGNKLASMLENIKDSFVCHFKADHTLMEGSYKPLGNKLADMLRSIKNFFVSHFKSKKTAPEKKK